MQRIVSDEAEKKGVSLSILRLDLIDEVTGGNKFFKLRYNLEEARKLDHDTLLTFGGTYSNHIAAVSAMGKKENFKTIGVIRGEEPKIYSHTLQNAKENGMQLVFWSREKYKQKNEYENIAELENELGRFYLIPEGGSNKLAVKGCAEILKNLEIPFDTVCLPVGTGGTISGINHSLKDGQKVLGFSALKDGMFLKEEVLKLLKSFEGKNFNRAEAEKKFEIIANYHFGGYAKHTDELVSFIKDFYNNHSIPLDFVYTGKMMFGLLHMIEAGYFNKGHRILAIHTGGLQGNKGINLHLE